MRDWKSRQQEGDAGSARADAATPRIGASDDGLDALLAEAVAGLDRADEEALDVDDGALLSFKRGHPSDEERVMPWLLRSGTARHLLLSQADPVPEALYARVLGESSGAAEPSPLPRPQAALPGGVRAAPARVIRPWGAAAALVAAAAIFVLWVSAFGSGSDPNQIATYQALPLEGARSVFRGAEPTGSPEDGALPRVGPESRLRFGFVPVAASDARPQVSVFVGAPGGRLVRRRAVTLTWHETGGVRVEAQAKTLFGGASGALRVVIVLSGSELPENQLQDSPGGAPPGAQVFRTDVLFERGGA